MSKALEEKEINVISQELQRIPNTLVELEESQEEGIWKLIEMLEEDDDIQAVYHNMK
jgi:transcriptional/translational regulatory protein YebC/TACO1